jgi:hypothetical protein
MDAEDKELVRLYRARKISYEDALRGAKSAGGVRREIREESFARLRSKLDGGDPPEPVESPRTPKRPPSNLSNAASPEKEPAPLTHAKGKQLKRGKQK